MKCKYCGAVMKKDSVGPYCPTRNCQWSLQGSGYKPAPPEALRRWRCKGCETFLSETNITRMDHGARQHPIMIRYHDGYEEEAWCGPVVPIADAKEGE
jgi:hypothetical protein